MEERRRHKRDRMTVEEQAFEAVDHRYNFQRPSDAEFEKAKFTGGDPVKKAVRALFDRLEGKLDAGSYDVKSFIQAEFFLKVGQDEIIRIPGNDDYDYLWVLLF